MEHAESVSSLVIVILAAFLTPILMHRFRLKMIPVVVAEIIVGLIIGHSGFNLVDESTWLETLSTLGFIFLMFLSGLEIDFSIFANKKTAKKSNKNRGNKLPNPVALASVVFVGIFALSLLLSYLFVLAGFIDNVFLMTLIISTISLGVVVPTLKEAQAMKTNIGQTILLIAVIADLVTMILLAVFVSFYGDGSGNMWLLLLLFVVGVLLYFVGKYFRNQTFIETMSRGTIQIGTRAVFTLIIFLVALSETVGAENILGAFLAGALVSLLSPNQELVQKLDSFGYGFLIPIFFVMVGVEIDIWSLFGDPTVLVLIPLLFIALLISKLFPVVFLKKWYDWKTVISSGMILTSTLSLVIAAATIGERMGVIDSQMESALILVAVLTCLITPPVFKKLFEHKDEGAQKQVISFVGSNQATLPVVRELDASSFEAHLYHTKQDKIDEHITRSVFDITQLETYDLEKLEHEGVFDVDMVVVSTGDEALNAEISTYAKEQGVGRVIARVESSRIDQELKDKGIEVFSVLLSTKTLLKALITAPSVVDILTQQESALYEIHMNNPMYTGIMLRKFPFTGDVIIVRIFRGKDSIVPHGDTELRLGDRIIVTGSHEYVDELQSTLEYGI
ncbi:monovalent cation:proton antiporter family protein [Aquibacillus koreensis]|uniref:Monovalent cation:proton antiporter family protein n=1 Tax=Aquibacillus koreensis TaxID=279446 RepID=A0A9X3WMK6_9BACI|nr:monovalent cation:proton antiporter family protein [Aquibacillus koreensis]MCT2535669.1 monovalent cation:proton antiporter family protein [Aquibacillus koreensis]MDC3420046.1 monovalent cation:proton antiporter family protein [Aquibacillus koreensis]